MITGAARSDFPIPPVAGIPTNPKGDTITMNAKKPLSIAIGTLAAVSFSLAASADQSGNPFEIEDLNQGTSISLGDEPKDEGKCGEGNCGEDKDEGKCGEGSCGEGNCGEDEDEGSCGTA